jgi:hypothetical protein
MGTLRTNKTSYTVRLDKLPPCLCWIIARRLRRPISLQEISLRSGVPLRSLARIFRKSSWATVKIGVADRVRKACGIVPGNEFRHVAYLKKTLTKRHPHSTLVHFGKRPAWARIVAARRLEQGLQSSAAAAAFEADSRGTRHVTTVGGVFAPPPESELGTGVSLHVEPLRPGFCSG